MYYVYFCFDVFLFFVFFLCLSVCKNKLFLCNILFVQESTQFIRLHTQLLNAAVSVNHLAVFQRRFNYYALSTKEQYHANRWKLNVPQHRTYLTNEQCMEQWLFYLSVSSLNYADIN